MTTTTTTTTTTATTTMIRTTIVPSWNFCTTCLVVWFSARPCSWRSVPTAAASGLASIRTSFVKWDEPLSVAGVG